jgi:hypothetical protein
MKILELKKLNLLGGIARLYLMLWLLWTLFLSATYHREIITVFGSDYWSGAKIDLRQSQLCEKCKNRTHGFFEVCPSTDDCKILKYSSSVDLVSTEYARQTVHELIYMTQIIPLAIGILGIIFLRLGRWVLEGFLK